MSRQATIQIYNLEFLTDNQELPLISKCNLLSSFLNQVFTQEINVDKAKYFYNTLPSILLNLYALPIDNEQDYYALYNLFNPNYHLINLFSVIIRPSFPSMLKYELDISSISSFFNQTDAPIGTNLGILKELLGDILIYNESTRHIYQRNKCLLPLFEYFIVIFLISAKNVEYTNRKYLNVSKEKTKGFSSFFFWRKSPIINQSLETDLNVQRSFQYNFYLNLFTKYLTFFYDNGMRTKLDFMFKALNTSWLHDYSINEDTSSIMLQKGKETKYSNIFTSIAPSSALLSPNRLNNQHYPNLLIVDCISELINFTYEKLQVDDILPLRKPLFYFMQFCFENKSTFYLTDVNMSDIIRLWFTYITPWVIKNEHYNNQNENLIEKFVNANIPFYITILDKCITAFSLDKNNEEDYIQFSKVLTLFSQKGEESHFVFKHLPFEQLKTCMLGDYKTFAGYDLIEKELGYFERKEINPKQIIIPFITNSSGRKAANKLIINNSMFMQKMFENEKEGNIQKNAQSLIDNLTIMNNIIKDLYQITSDELPQILKENIIKYHNQRQLHLNKILTQEKNPWNSLKQDDEISWLYSLFKIISKGVDALRGLRRSDNKNVSLTNLRPLCNMFTLLNLLTIFILFYVLSYIIYFTSNIIWLNNK